MPPLSLYKFQKLNMQTIQNLKNAEIYFNPPVSFNDPFDCSTLEASVILNDKAVVDVFKRYMMENNISLNCTINSIKDVPPKYIDQICSGFEKTLKQKQNSWLNETGCACFSETKDNILMWSHYADGHKGICLEFDFSFNPFNKAKKVIYSSDFPSIDPMRLIDYKDKLDDELLKPLFTKHEGWSYEQEWRVFHKEPNKLYGHGVDALKAVYFGCSVNYTDIEIVCLILQGQSKNIKFCRASLVSG